MTYTTDYFGNLFNPEILTATVKAMVGMIKESKIQFDTIVFRGNSGAMIAPMVAAKLKKNLLLVRKAGDGSHSSNTVVGYSACEKYIVIDDFVCTGATVQAIVDKLAGHTYYSKLTNSFEKFNGNSKLCSVIIGIMMMASTVFQLTIRGLCIILIIFL